MTAVLEFYETVARVWHRKLAEEGLLVQGVCKSIHAIGNLRGQLRNIDLTQVRYCAGCRRVDDRASEVAWRLGGREPWPGKPLVLLAPDATEAELQKAADILNAKS